MATQGLSPSVFADKIGIQRSSVSHILSGRNKPGLEMIIKIISTFPEVDAEWLLMGHKKPEKEIQLTPAPSVSIEHKIDEQITEVRENSKVITGNTESDAHKKIVKTILFYSDGTFESFYPKS